MPASINDAARECPVATRRPPYRRANRTLVNTWPMIAKTLSTMYTCSCVARNSMKKTAQREMGLYSWPSSG